LGRDKRAPRRARRTYPVGVLCAVNSALRRQRRRLVMLGLAGAVVSADSVMGGDHMGDGVAVCLAVAQTAVIAVRTALCVGLALYAAVHGGTVIVSTDGGAHRQTRSTP
jgi:hypothetical protein